MKIYDKKKIGRRTYTVVGEGNNLFECAFELSKLSFGDVDACGKCGKDDLIIRARIAESKKQKNKKFEYVEVYCLDCKSSVVFGKMLADPNIFFLRKNDEKKPDWQNSMRRSDDELEQLINENTK